MMSRKIYHVKLAAKSLSVATVLLSCLCSSVHAWAADSPLDLIRSTTNQALAVLADSPAPGKEQRQQQLERMWEIVLPRFDTDEIAKRSLGVHWETLTEDQKKEFTHLYMQLIKKNYGSTLERYTKDAQFFFDRENIDDDYAEVDTRIIAPSQEKPFSVVYRLHRAGGKWLIHDVVAENVSLVQNYRNQFSRIIAQSSAGGLLEALKRKIAELKAT
jgi:phospholipid transport system substrate-binding protein